MGFTFTLSIFSICCELCFTSVTSKNFSIKQSTKQLSIAMDDFSNLSLKDSPDSANNNHTLRIFTTQTYSSSPASSTPHTFSPPDTQSNTSHNSPSSLHPLPRPTPHFLHLPLLLTSPSSPTSTSSTPCHLPSPSHPCRPTQN